jgi:Na+/melibiose symporter-like transporter
MKRYLPAILSALVVALLAVGYALFWFLVLDEAEILNVVKWIIAGGTALVVGGLAWAAIARIRELKGGQEDDLGKY